MLFTDHDPSGLQMTLAGRRYAALAFGLFVLAHTEGQTQFLKIAGILSKAAIDRKQKMPR